MRESETIGRKAMSRLLEGLRRWPGDYDSHPFAAEEFVGALLADIQVPMPPPLRPEGGGGWSLIKAIALLVLDSIHRLLRESGRDKPLAGDERLTGLEQLLVGFIVVWFKDIQPARKEPGSPDRSVTYSEAIDAGESPLFLSRLMEQACQDAKQRSRHRQWIPGAFNQLHKQGETGHRKVGYYRDKALSSLAQRITQTGHGLNLDVEGLLRELAGAGSVPQAADIEWVPDVAQAPEVVPGGALDWATQLSQCVDDYRGYELQEIERLIKEHGLTSSFDWFLPRQVCCPVSQSEVGKETPVLDLADICKPGLRIALLDIRGSGTTAALLGLSNRYCREEVAVEPIVLRIDAQDYADAAANDLSVYAYLAEKIYGKERTLEENRESFERTLSKAQVICLVDNLSRLSFEDQVRIGRRLRRFAGVVFVAPWTTDDELAMIGGQGTVCATLEPFDEVQIRQFIIEFGARVAPGFDELLGQRLACDMLDIAALPLGLIALCEQVCLHRGDCVSVAQRFITELFLRSEKPAPDWHLEYRALPPELGVLMKLAVPIYASTMCKPASDGGLHNFDEEWVLRYLGEMLRKRWLDARTSPLLIQTGLQTYRFLNPEVFGFLAAMANIKGVADQCSDYARDMFRPGIVGIVNRYYYTWLRNDDEEMDGVQ
jgi:hypothetical protein